MSGATQLREAAEAIAEDAPSLSPSPLSAALVLALADLMVVGADRTANAGTYSYKYADIADVVKATRPVLQKHGLVALTPVHAHGDGLACSVWLVHSSGERMILGPFPFPHGRDAQATGSAVTYHRRYALIAALGMAAGDDDDGAGAIARSPAPVWNKVTTKQALLALCDGDSGKAKTVWAEAGGEGLTVYGADTAAHLLAAWEIDNPAGEGEQS